MILSLNWHEIQAKERWSTQKTEEESIEFNLFADWCLIRLYFLHIFLCECKGKWLNFSILHSQLDSAIIQRRMLNIYFSFRVKSQWDNGHFSFTFVIFNENNAFYPKWNWIFSSMFVRIYFSECLIRVRERKFNFRTWILERLWWESHNSDDVMQFWWKFIQCNI